MPTTFDPSVTVASVLYPRPVAGFRRLVQASHPMCNGGAAMTLLSTDVSFNNSGSPNYTKYSYAPGVGSYQKAIHTAGTRETSWTIGGEVTTLTLPLLALFYGSARGIGFRQLLVSQGTVNSLGGQHSFFWDNPPVATGNRSGWTLPWNSISLSGHPNAGLTFSVEGKATIEPLRVPVPLLAPVPVPASPPVPTWATGSDYVLSWSLSHNVNLQPVWLNDGKMVPAYYRVLDSEFTLQLTTAVALSYSTLVKIGLGYINPIEMLVTSGNITFGDRNSPITYEVSSTNARVADQSAYTEFVSIVVGNLPDAGYG
jgi:hypothetical protein